MVTCDICGLDEPTGHCDDCAHAHRQHNMSMVIADYGKGAFIAILCDQCDHRRWYRAQLERRRKIQASLG